MKISRWRLRGVIGALSLIVVGGFLGMLTDRFVLAEVRRVEPVTVGEHEAISEHHAASTAFRRVLQLDDGQAAAIHEILLRHQGVVDESWESLRARVHQEVQSAHEEIRVLLSPPQQERFEAWLDRHVRAQPNEDPRRRWAH
ncbi:MAG: hypothetical protein V3W35_01905 [Gemmatimonadota bacterium]